MSKAITINDKEYRSLIETSICPQLGGEFLPVEETIPTIEEIEAKLNQE